MDELFRAIDGNRPGSLNDFLRMTVFPEPLFEVLNRPDPSYDNCTPLLYALRRRGILPEIVRLLLEAGSCTEAGHFGALHCALSGHQSLAVLQLLIEFKADIFRLTPLEVSEADEKAAEAQEFSLLHLALFVGASSEVVQLLCREGGSLLINNQQNLLKETPLIFAIKRGLNFHDLASLGDLTLLDADGLSAYACAAATLNPALCLQLECLAVTASLSSASQTHHFSFGQVRRALHKFHDRDSLRLEILFAPAEEHVHAGWCDFWGDLLEHGGPEHVSLAVDGYWKWCGEWQEAAIQEGSLQFNCQASVLPPPNCTVQRFRLRKRMNLEESFLSEAVKLITSAEDEYYDAELTVTESVINKFKQAFSVLMTGIRSCEDGPLKAKAAEYLQLAMQRMDSLAPDQGSFTGSSLNLPALTNANANANASTASLPAVTKTFPLQRLASKIFRRNPFPRPPKKQDELKFCPVCSAKLPDSEDPKVEHLNACLMQSTTSIRGDRYTVHVLSTPDSRECPICCEEFVVVGGGSERIAVMNCLCRFHERCIERWFTRSPTCPFHSD